MQIETINNSNVRIALIVPLWNEFSRGSFEYLDKLVLLEDINFFLVNDGSTDDTKLELLRYVEIPNVETINLTKNLGKAGAIKIGFQEAIRSQKYSLIGFLDGDGAFEVEEVQRCLAAAELKICKENYEVFCSSRVALAGHRIERSFRRHVAGRIVRSIIEIRHKQLPYDTQSGLKLFSATDSLSSCLDKGFETRWFVDLEIILNLRTKNQNLKIWEEPLLSWRDVGKSSIKFSSWFSIFRELLIVLKIKPSL